MKQEINYRYNCVHKSILKYFIVKIIICYISEDTTPPTVFQCPNEVRLEVELGTTTTVVTYDEPFATDNSNAPMLLQTQTCQSGGLFPVGENSCLYLFADPDGNSATCTFFIIVTTSKYIHGLMSV